LQNDGSRRKPPRGCGTFCRSRSRRRAGPPRPADAAEIFTDFVQSAGLELRHVEEEIEGSGLGAPSLELPTWSLAPKPVVVDAKWGGFSYRRGALENGTATQLAFYAHVLRQQEGFDATAASVAFFVLSRGRIITTDSTLGSRAEAVDGPSHTETWLALERAFGARRDELGRGLVVATANPDDLGEGVPLDDSSHPTALWCSPQVSMVQVRRPLRGYAGGGSQMSRVEIISASAGTGKMTWLRHLITRPWPTRRRDPRPFWPRPSPTARRLSSPSAREKPCSRSARQAPHTGSTRHASAL